MTCGPDHNDNLFCVRVVVLVRLVKLSFENA